MSLVAASNLIRKAECSLSSFVQSRVRRVSSNESGMLSSFGPVRHSNVFVVAFESSRPVPLGRHSHRTHLHAHSPRVGSCAPKPETPNTAPGPNPSSLNLYSCCCSSGHIRLSLRSTLRSKYVSSDVMAACTSLVRYSITRCRSGAASCSRVARHLISLNSHVNNRIHIGYQHLQTTTDNARQQCIDV